MMTNNFKHILRQTCRQKRNMLPIDEQRAASKQICASIMSLIQYQSAKAIALYQAVNGEIDLTDMWHAAHLQNKACYFPVINTNQSLTFLPVTPETTWSNNRFGIPEPNVSYHLALTPEQFDIMFIPLLAFDELGNRLGMGGGYYDKTLAICKPALRIGIAYDFQWQPSIQTEIWDVPLTAIITPSTIYWSKHDKLLVDEI